MNYQLHELATLFPGMTDEEYQTLRLDVRNNGLIQPIVLWRESDADDWEIIDGRHRALVCEDLGIDPTYIYLQGDIDPVQYIISVNSRRRHLTESQLGMIAQKLSQYSPDDPPVKAKNDTVHGQNYTQREAADLLGISTSTIARAKKIGQSGTPTLQSAVASGSVALRDAEAIVNRPAEVQDEAVRRVQEAEAQEKRLRVQDAMKDVEREIRRAKWEETQAQRRAAPALNEVQLFHASCAELHRHVGPESVDIILTDPPYKPDTLSCYRDLAEFAVHSLKPGGVLLAMSGTSHLPQVMEYLCNTEGLNYHWTLNYMMPGGNLRFHTRAVRMGWKPVIWLVKCKSDGTDRFDVVEAPRLAIQDTRFHEWGQNEGGFKKLLDLFAFPGQIVCDPFLGGGTTAVVARAAGCGFIGADIDGKYLEITEQRLQDE